MLCTWKACPSLGLASTSTFASSHRPPSAAASRSRTGLSCLHGPHQSAQKSMTTGTVMDCSTTRAWKSASLTSMTAALAFVAPAAPAGAPLPAGGPALDASEERSTAPYGLILGWVMYPSCPQRAPLRRPPSEPRGLAVVAPLTAQRVADLPERRLGPGRVEHRGHHVRVGAGDVDQGGQRGLDPGAVAVGPSFREHPVLLALDLVGDPQDLQRLLDGLGVAVDADDLLLARLQGAPLGAGRRGAPGHEPAVLDPAQEAGRDGPGAAHVPGPGEDRLRLGLEPVGQRLDVPGASERVGDVGDSGLLH